MDKEIFVEECVAEINKANVMITDRDIAEGSEALNFALQSLEEAINHLNEYLEE